MYKSNSSAIFSSPSYDSNSAI